MICSRCARFYTSDISEPHIIHSRRISLIYRYPSYISYDEYDRQYLCRVKSLMTRSQHIDEVEKNGHHNNSSSAASVLSQGGKARQGHDGTELTFSYVVLSEGVLGVKHARVDEVGRLVVASDHEDFSGLASTGRWLYSLVKQQAMHAGDMKRTLAFPPISASIYCCNVTRTRMHASRLTQK